MTCTLLRRAIIRQLFWFHGFSSHVTKASEASWSYSCDSKVSFDRVQILTPDFSGPPPHPPPSLSLSHSHCLSLSLSSLSLSLISLISLISPSSLSHLSLISLSSLSLSPLCLSFIRLSSLSSLAGGSGQRATYKGLFTWECSSIGRSEPHHLQLEILEVEDDGQQIAPKTTVGPG